MKETLTWIAAVNPSNMEAIAKSQDETKLRLFIRGLQTANPNDYPFVAFPRIKDDTFPEAKVIL